MFRFLKGPGYILHSNLSEALDVRYPKDGYRKDGVQKDLYRKDLYLKDIYLKNKYQTANIF